MSFLANLGGVRGPRANYTPHRETPVLRTPRVRRWLLEFTKFTTLGEESLSIGQVRSHSELESTLCCVALFLHRRNSLQACC